MDLERCSLLHITIIQPFRIESSICRCRGVFSVSFLTIYLTLVIVSGLMVHHDSGLWLCSNVLQNFEIYPRHLYYLSLLTTIYFILLHKTQWYNRGIIGKTYIHTEKSEMIGTYGVDKEYLFGKLKEQNIYEVLRSRKRLHNPHGK